MASNYEMTLTQHAFPNKHTEKATGFQNCGKKLREIQVSASYILKCMLMLK